LSDACPHSNALAQWHEDQRAGVGQATKDETAGRSQPSNLLVEMGENGWELVGFADEKVWFKRRKASKDGLQSLFEE
jgi:hypothetical protein